MNDDKKKTAKQAQIVLTNKINRLIGQVKQTTIIHGITFEELLNEYLTDEFKRIRRSTYYNHKTMQQTLLEIFPASSLVENMTPLIISQKLEEVMYGERKLSSGYVSKFKYFMHAVFNFAVEHSYVDSNQINEVKLNYKSPISGQQIKNKFLEDNEMEALLNY